jgi:predicted transcriptional regulator
MMQTKNETVKLDEDVCARLNELAQSSGRPLHVLVNLALRRFLHRQEQIEQQRYHEHVVQQIERGIADLDAGRVFTTEQVRERLGLTKTKRDN